MYFFRGWFRSVHVFLNVLAFVSRTSIHPLFDVAQLPPPPPPPSHSCTLTEVSQSADCKMLVHSVGEQSQWGKIRATLVSEPSETPLQLKLNHMAKLIG